MRTTSSTRQALERLAEASGTTLTRDGKLFCVHTPGVDDPPIGKSSARALAFLISCVRHLPSWEDLRQATMYDPGIDAVGKPKTSSQLAAWEQMELRKLAVTDV